MDPITYHPIGTIHSPFHTMDDMPIQPSGATGAAGSILLEPDYRPGLDDLDGFSHIILLYHFHRAPGPRLHVTPFLDDSPRGLFATRAPTRPNPIGLSIVQLERIEGNTLHIVNVDVLDGTPLIDIKPYVPAFDAPDEKVRTGWIGAAGGSPRTARSDRRFDTL